MVIELLRIGHCIYFLRFRLGCTIYTFDVSSFRSEFFFFNGHGLVSFIGQGSEVSTGPHVMVFPL